MAERKRTTRNGGRHDGGSRPAASVMHSPEKRTSLAPGSITFGPEPSGSFGPVGAGTFGPVGAGTFGPVGSGPFYPVAVARVRPSTGRQVMFESGAWRGLGWVRDLPDFRDASICGKSPSYHFESLKPAEHTSYLEQKQKLDLYEQAIPAIRAKADTRNALPSAVDNSGYCSPVEDQGQLGACTAFAAVGMVEYMERRAFGKHVDASHLFLYKVSRKLLGWTGDTGAYLRTAMKALVLFGVPPDDQCPYNIQAFDEEPDAYLYSYASNYKAVQYVRLDPASVKPEELLGYIKAALKAGYAVMFGFSVYSSISADENIPYPGPLDTQIGGHAVLAVGYNDHHENVYADLNAPEKDKEGALLIRNSWGVGWGDYGYGWLPYRYVLDGLAADFWVCIKQEWVDTGRFE